MKNNKHATHESMYAHSPPHTHTKLKKKEERKGDLFTT